MHTDTAQRIRILLAEDDPVSRDFLTDALRGLPAEVIAVPDARQALHAARLQPFDLLVLDRRLPWASAPELLAQLQHDNGPNAGTPALALSADVNPTLRLEFKALGFVDLLAKPIAATTLRHRVRAVLATALPAWDAQQALSAAHGQRDIVERLRELLLTDLPNQREEVLVAIHNTDVRRAHDVLHRLKAACGFCGAAALAAATSALDDVLQQPSGVSETQRAVDQFVAACDQLLS